MDGWQSGRLRPADTRIGAVRLFVGSNPTPSHVIPRKRGDMATVRNRKSARNNDAQLRLVAPVPATKEAASMPKEPKAKAHPLSSNGRQPKIVQVFPVQRFTVKYTLHRNKRPVRQETFETKPTAVYIRKAIAQYRAECAELHDSELPEVMAYYTDCGDVMYCPADQAGYSISSEPLKFFPIMNKLPKSEAQHLIISHQISIGHALNKKLKAKLHDDGLPRKRPCLNCEKVFEIGHWMPGYTGADYGQRCCSITCYAQAHAKGVDWLSMPGATREPKPPAAKKKPAKPRDQDDELPSEKRCPSCGHVGPTDIDFGYRVMRGKRKPQSYCKRCR